MDTTKTTQAQQEAPNNESTLAETMANAVVPTVASLIEGKGAPEAIATLADELDKANAYITALEAKIKTTTAESPALTAVVGIVKKWFPHEAGLLDELL
jgi:hypothetical protein